MRSGFWQLVQTISVPLATNVGATTGTWPLPENTVSNGNQWLPPSELRRTRTVFGTDGVVPVRL